MAILYHCTLQPQPGVSTASWEVTGVLYRGGVIKLPRARSARVFSPPQARKFWRY